MKIKGIGMTARNVPKVMDGSKTQTRRIIKDCFQYMPHGWHEDGISYGFRAYSCDEVAFWKKARHQIGDVLYIKEALRICESGNDRLRDLAVYKSDGLVVSSGDMPRFWESDDGKPWKPKVLPARYMPRSAARTFIKITDVRCERVQDISKEDCISEGVQIIEGSKCLGCETPFVIETIQATGACVLSCGTHECNYGFLMIDDLDCDEYRRHFRRLWNDTNGKGAWERNDWTFAYTFELTEMPDEP